MRIENKSNKKELLDLIGKKIPIWKDFVGFFNTFLLFSCLKLFVYCLIEEIMIKLKMKENAITVYNEEHINKSF
jgi:hypothetical protein